MVREAELAPRGGDLTTCDWPGTGWTGVLHARVVRRPAVQVELNIILSVSIVFRFISKKPTLTLIYK